MSVDGDFLISFDWDFFMSVDKDFFMSVDRDFLMGCMHIIDVFRWGFLDGCTSKMSFNMGLLMGCTSVVFRYGFFLKRGFTSDIGVWWKP